MAVTAWQFAPVVSAALGCLAAGYLAAVLAVARRHPARLWPATRTAISASSSRPRPGVQSSPQDPIQGWRSGCRPVCP